MHCRSLAFNISAPYVAFEGTVTIYSNVTLTLTEATVYANSTVIVLDQGVLDLSDATYTFIFGMTSPLPHYFTPLSAIFLFNSLQFLPQLARIFVVHSA